MELVETFQRLQFSQAFISRLFSYHKQYYTPIKCEITVSHGGEYKTVLWDIAPCSVVEIYRRFEGAYCIHYQGDHIGQPCVFSRSSLFEVLRSRMYFFFIGGKRRFYDPSGHDACCYCSLYNSLTIPYAIFGYIFQVQLMISVLLHTQ
jgi:hypothetical protein